MPLTPKFMIIYVKFAIWMPMIKVTRRMAVCSDSHDAAIP
jgi:hypothetical protein